MAEWRLHWPLVLSAALGYSVTGLGTFSLGPMIAPLQEEFGWSRTQITIGLSIAGILGAVMSVPVGMLIDRFGPRRIGLAGVTFTTGTFALLSTATGSSLNWLLLWILYAFAFLGLQATVWTSAIAASFERSRGVALAFTMSGGSVAAIIVPLLITFLISAYGWRIAFLASGLLWAAVAIPLMLLFFRSTQDKGKPVPEHGGEQPAPVELHGVTIREGFRSATFYKLLLSAGLFTFTLLGLVVHFIPILQELGVDQLDAAGVASLIGIFSIIGRLGTGFLLDRFPGNLVGAAIFLLSVMGCILLLLFGDLPVVHMVAAAAFGVTLGAEMGVIAFLASWHFGLKNLGVLLGALTAALALGTALGPLAGSAAFDHFDSYTNFLVMAAILLVIAVAAVATVPRQSLCGQASY